MIQKCSFCSRPVRAEDGTCPFCATRGTSTWAKSLVVLAAPMVLAACYGDPGDISHSGADSDADAYCNRYLDANCADSGSVTDVNGSDSGEGSGSGSGL